MVKKLNIAVSVFLVYVLISMSFASFDFRSLDVKIIINPDGSAHVSEESNIFITTEKSIELYKQSRVFNDISTWIEVTNISSITTHLNQKYVSLSNLKVSPEPVRKCNTIRKTCHAMIVLDYDINSITADKNNTGIMKEREYKPRTTRFSLRTVALNFPRSETDDLLLSDGTSLYFTIPKNSQYIRFSSTPNNIDPAKDFVSINGTEYYVGDIRTFKFSSPTLPRFSISYEIENSLEQEIVDFFTAIQNNVFTIVLSEDGIAYIFTIAVFLLSIIWLNALNIK